MNRLRRLSMVALAAAWFGLVGCSDDTDPKVDGAVDAAADQLVEDVGPELAVPDSTPDSPQNVMGHGCTKKSECGGDAPDCLVVSNAKQAGFCTSSCTPDDSTTPLINEDNCPKNFYCSGIQMTSGTESYYCLQECVPSTTTNPCLSKKISCHPTSSRYIKPNQAVCFYTACENDKDCPVWSLTACQKDTDCTSVGTGAFCDDNFCAMPGKCMPSGLCGKHPGVGKATAKVGDPCKSDLDCAENGRCLGEDTKNEGGFGVGWRNGYCVVRGCMFSDKLPDFDCGPGAVCNYSYYGGYCFKECALNDAKGCRDYSGDKGGDYECYDWTGWTTSGVKMALKPMCMEASGQTCDSVNSTNGCAAIGDSTNSTNMKCRDRYTGKSKSNPKDPSGICLDDTASGIFDTTGPDGGVTTPDAGTPDAATLDAATPDAATPDAATMD